MNADLVLVDWNLEEWPARMRGALAVWPEDGLALVAIFRAHLLKLKKQAPTAFALQSAYVADLSGDMPPEYRAHALARLLNLEWIFERSKVLPTSVFARQVGSLADAVVLLPDEWPSTPSDQQREVLGRLLAIPRRVWTDAAWLEIEACHPPIHELAIPSNGVSVLRWLLHRILPYPCFLWDAQQVALRLGVQASSIRDVLESEAARRMGFSSCQFTGVLSEFAGPRWWRSGIESLVWRLTKGDPRNRDKLAAFVQELGVGDHLLDPRPHVACLDEHLRPLPKLYPAEDAVRIAPDDWPVFADVAWTTIDIARANPPIRALVLSDDAGRLEQHGRR